MYKKDDVFDSTDEWVAWLLSQEDQRINIYLISPDQLIADYRRERQITRDYQGR